MPWSIAIRIAIPVSLAMLTGCTALSPEDAFNDVAADVDARAGQSIHWLAADADNGDLKRASAALLARELTPASAARLALLNNKQLQARYAELGIAHAELVQAALPPNPLASASLTFAEGGATNLVFSGAMQVIELLRIPLKKRVAASRLEEAKIEVAADVLRVVAEAQVRAIEYQGAQQALAHLRGVRETAKANFSAARSLREAGNITAFEFEQQNADLVSAELELKRARSRTQTRREALNRVMGLRTGQTDWRGQAELPGVPAQAIALGGSARQAITNSLELTLARQKLHTLERAYRLTSSRSLAPDVEAGGEWERDDGSEEAGPSIAAALPLFDWGQARRARGRMEMARARHAHDAMEARVQSTARALAAELRGTHEAALYHQKTALPQAQRLLRAAQRQHNAMQIGIFDLIRAKRGAMSAKQSQIAALTDYWVARAKFSQLMKGTLPTGTAAPEKNGRGAETDEGDTR